MKRTFIIPRNAKSIHSFCVNGICTRTPVISSSCHHLYRNHKDRQQQQQQQSRKQRQQQQYRLYRTSRALNAKDYYEVLGLPKESTKDEIKKKFRELAKKYHPDLNKDNKSAEAKFREVSEAYEVLEDDQKRKQYDTFGHMDPNNGGGGGFQGGGPFGGFGGFGGGPFSAAGGGNMNNQDIFSFLHQAMGQQQEAARNTGIDVEMVLPLSFLEAVSGCTKKVEVEYVAHNAAGRRERKKKQVQVTVPAGVDAGMQLRMQGQGGEGAKGYPAGDLLLQLKIDADPYFKREGGHIKVELPVTIAQAATNLIVIAPVPDANGPYSLTLDVIRNMPVPATDADYLQIDQATLVAQGAQAIILGCTEITLLVGAEDATVPLFDTTALHAIAAAEYALAAQ